ncbi:hypothetical protein NSS82_10170 [Paenibacillus sp. FSL H7-0735]|uniref:hypothetical protein n=1 Tax=Paenibacillus sp. FSL H7-0735 TaxID=2954736 RepID=UPI0030F510FF
MAVPLPALHTHTLRGDAAMKNQLPEGNVVKTVWIGESKIEFCDDFVARTPEAIAQVERDFHLAGWKIVMKLREQGIYI